MCRVSGCLCSISQRFCSTLMFFRQTILYEFDRSFWSDMILSVSAIAGITTAVFTVLIAGLGTVIYINRRRHQIRNKISFRAKTIAHSSPNTSRLQMLSSSAFITDPTKRTQDYHGRYPSLEKGPGPTVVKKGWSSMRSDFQSLKDTSNLPAIGSLDTCNNLTMPSARATVGADEGAPVPNTMTEPVSTGATTLAAARTMEIKRGPEDALKSRPSSLHQAVLDVG